MRGPRRALAPLVLLVLVAGCGDGDRESRQHDRDGAHENLSSVEIPDCYGRSGLDVAAPTLDRALFVLVDQTTGLDDRLRETVRSNVQRLLAPGTSFTVSTFSAFSRGRYTTNLDAGTVHSPVPEEEQPSLPVRRLERLESCLRHQLDVARAHAEAALTQAAGADSSSFSHSEIMASLAQLSEAVRASSARDKIVIVVSDLLEHSDTTSFYRNRNIRIINADEELASAERLRLLGDFGNARVAIVGAGLLSPDARDDATRNAEALAALRRFWEEWFRRSNAQVIAYGQPDLMTPIR